MKPRAYKNTAATETININQVSKPVNARGEEIDVPRGTIFGGAVPKTSKRPVIGDHDLIEQTAFYKWLQAKGRNGLQTWEFIPLILEYMAAGEQPFKGRTDGQHHKSVFNVFVSNRKVYSPECYFKNPDTGEAGWAIEFPKVFAQSQDEAADIIQQLPHFDCFIDYRWDKYNV